MKVYQERQENDDQAKGSNITLKLIDCIELIMHAAKNIYTAVTVYVCIVLC